MPIYEFVCCKCDHAFEYLALSASEENPACPKCDSKSVQKLMSAGSVRPHGIPTGSGGFALPKCAANTGG